MFPLARKPEYRQQQQYGNKFNKDFEKGPHENIEKQCLTVIVQNSAWRYHSSMMLMREMDNLWYSDAGQMVCNFTIILSLWLFGVHNLEER